MKKNHKYTQNIQSYDGTQLSVEILDQNHSDWLILTHGIGEHLGRHQYIYDLLKDNYNICLYDLRGHGNSKGERGSIKSFSQFRRDLQSLLIHLRNSYEVNSFSLFGHSMGGLIVCDFIQSALYKKVNIPIKSVFLSSPAIGVAGPLGRFLNFLPFKIHQALSGAPISFSMQGLNDYSYLSHDPKTIELYEKDNLVLKEFSTSLLLNLVKTAKKISNRNLNSPCPVYCSVGSSDQIVDYDKICSYLDNQDDTYINRVEGGFHELHNEISQYKDSHIGFIKMSLT